jgi:hypothetical protein
MTNTPCFWYGVTCENGGVTQIKLYSLTGTIPNFSGLPNLQNLYLDENQLTGEIPDFCALPNLQTLYLSDNHLTGAIPDFSALPNLQTLSLSWNQLTGVIPDFSALPNLQTLSLSDNYLTGEIPDFSALPNLQALYLHDNKVCKDININYSSWQEELNTFPNCPVNPLPATVKMQLNQSRYTTSNPLRLDMQVNGQGMVDLYVAIVFPYGDLMTIAYPLSFSWLNAIQIYQPAVEIAGEKIYPIMDFPLPAGITTGGYQACGVLVLAGEYHSEDNWIDKHCVGFEVY